jgi:hypothetical protein
MVAGAPFPGVPPPEKILRDRPSKVNYRIT